MSNEYRAEPACPACGAPAPPDWENSQLHDYYWRGWQTGDGGSVYCPCGLVYSVVARCDVTFKSFFPKVVGPGGRTDIERRTWK